MQTVDIIGPAPLRMLGMVLRLTREKGRPPSFCELMREGGYASPNAVAYLLGVLKRAGLVTWEAVVARTLRPTCRVEVVEAAPGKRKVRRG